MDHNAKESAADTQLEQLVQIAAQLEVAHQGTQGDLPPSVRRKGGDLQDRWSDNPAA